MQRMLKQLTGERGILSMLGQGRML